MSGNDGDEATIANVKADGGRFELTTRRLLVFKDSAVASAIGGGVLGALGGLVGGALQAASNRKAAAELPLASIVSAKATPGKGGKGTMVLAFANGKEASIPDMPDVVAFVAKINEQVAKLRPATPATATPAAAAAPSAAAPTIAKPGTVITLDTRVKHLPGWQALQHWSAAALAGDPADVRLTIDAPTESAFLRTKEELADCTVRLVYRFSVLPRFAYVSLRLRSRADGKSFTLVRLNSKGELFVGTGAPQGTQAWARHAALHADPTQPNEARVEVTGSTLKLFLNGTLAITKDGVDGPTGRIVIGGGADPKPAEIAVGALSIQAG